MSFALRMAAVLVAGIALAGPASAQDYGPYGVSGSTSLGSGYGFDWDGFYAGVYGGGVPFGTTSWNAGVFSGVNVAIDSAVVGVEAQLGADIDGSTSIDALVLGKGGVSLGDALIYATGGTGLISGDFGYALGGGAEYGFTDYMSVRGEVLGTGSWGSMPSDMRVTAGVAFHL
ncbi:outer membrane protein [Pelagibacterium sp.]|uniref:outer membrane protein n=1 Tax=Pelagibacterium sp. TaxID=1967288 RepID=UPI003A8FB924